MKENDLEKWMYEKTDMTINDYPKKKLIVADIIRNTDKKTELMIFDRETEELLYNNRCEFIEWTSEGCASSLCGKEIEYIDATVDGKIELHVNMNNEEVQDIIRYPKNSNEHSIALDSVSGGLLMIEYEEKGYIPIHHKAKAGDKVILIVIPDDGCTFNHGDIIITCLQSRSNINSFSEYRFKKFSKYEFIMPNEDINIHVTFVKEMEE